MKTIQSEAGNISDVQVEIDLRSQTMDVYPLSAPHNQPGRPKVVSLGEDCAHAAASVRRQPLDELCCGAIAARVHISDDLAMN
eukprot:2728414-Amphidinium_carterae.1